MKIAVTGVTGNMGGYFLWALNMSPAAADTIKFLCRDKKKAKKIIKHNEAISDKLQEIFFWGYFCGDFGIWTKNNKIKLANGGMGLQDVNQPCS